MVLPELVHLGWSLLLLAVGWWLRHRGWFAPAVPGAPATSGSELLDFLRSQTSKQALEAEVDALLQKLMESRGLASPVPVPVSAPKAPA